MKSLLLMRHGKSNWDADYVGDHRRPLSARGVKASKRMGRFFAKRHLVPDIVVCSTSLRTRETLEIAMQEADWIDVDVVYDETVYMASYEQMVSCIRMLPDEGDLAMIVGHEPTTSLLAGQLIGGGSIRFPTAALARIDLNVSHWKSCRSGVGTLQWHVTPRLLKKR